MKVKKEITVLAKDIVVGDVVVACGEVIFVRTNSYGEVQYVYTEGDYILTDDWNEDCRVDVIREVERPDSVTVSSLFGTILRFSGASGDSVQVDITNRIDLAEGLVFSAQELIDAIKAVKGME